MTEHGRGRCGGAGQLRIPEQAVVGQRARPAQQRAGAPVGDHLHVVGAQDLRGGVVVAGRGRMHDRLDVLTSCAQPPGRAPMDGHHSAGIIQAQLGGGELRKQRMHAEPLAALETEQEHVGLLELGEPRRRIRAPEHVIAELHGEAAQDRHAEQERAAVGIKRGEHLLAEVLGDVAMIAAELEHGPTLIIHGAKPEGGEVQRSGPALGSPAQGRDLFLVQARDRRGRRAARSSPPR